MFCLSRHRVILFLYIYAVILFSSLERFFYSLFYSLIHSSLSAYYRVPERVTYLREVLDSDPSRLKEVFLESMKLENLRFGLVDEIQLSKDRRSSVIGAGTVCLSLSRFVFIFMFVVYKYGALDNYGRYNLADFQTFITS